MAKYRVSRTAIVRQYKYVTAPVGACDADVLEAAWDVGPWIEAKVLDTDHVEVEMEND